MTEIPEDPAERPAGMTRYRRRRRIRAAVGTGVALAVLGAVAIAGRGFGGTEAQAPAASNLPPGTATVSKATLVQTERVSGTLGYGAATVLNARASAAPPPADAANANQGANTNQGGANPGQGTDPGQGGAPAQAAGTPQPTRTLTWLPPIGTTVKPGQPVFKVDDKPVVLITGSTPLYRVLADGVTGADVKQFEENLRAFGYRGITVDTKYTSATATAVKQWQRKLGLEQTGTVDVNQVAIAPGELRVTEHKAALGSEANGPVLSYTGTTRVVTVPLEVSRQHLVSVGLSAQVSLPDGRTTTGTVASIGTVASTPNSEQGGPGGQQQGGEATVEVIVTIADQAALGTLDAAPVALVLTTAERKDVLTVPVGALVALAEGGYGVQVVEGSTTRYVAVRTGMFAGGKVEVSGDGIADGVTVGVPS